MIADAIARTNTLRTAQGQSRIQSDAKLNRAALKHACDLASSGTFSHTGTDGSSVGDRVRGAAYSWSYVAENIAWGQNSADAVVSSWAGSAAHRRNMLSSRAEEIGIASVPSDRGPIWVMVLAAGQ
ncbi:MAG: CAP domain-containing protein [Pseudomonadota bacterium]